MREAAEEYDVDAFVEVEAQKAVLALCLDAAGGDFSGSCSVPGPVWRCLKNTMFDRGDGS